MSIEQRVLEVLLKNGSLDDADQNVMDTVRLAVDKGYSHLSESQQNIVQPLLSQTCDGAEDPGGYANNCLVTLEGSTLVKALSDEPYNGGMLCDSCATESGLSVRLHQSSN
jgi:hypothetical protein